MGHRDVGGGDEVLVAVGRHLDVGGKAAEPVEHRRNCGPESVRRVGILERHAVHGKRRGECVGVDRAAGAVVGIYAANVGEAVAGDKLLGAGFGTVDPELRDAGKHHATGEGETEGRVKGAGLRRRAGKDIAAGLLIDIDPRRESGDGIRSYRPIGGDEDREIRTNRRVDVLALLQIKGGGRHCQIRLRQNLQRSVRYNFKRNVGEVGIEVGELTGVESIRIFADCGLGQVGDTRERDGRHRVEVFPARHLDAESGNGLLVAVIITGPRRTINLDDHRRVANDPDDGGGDEVLAPICRRLDIGNGAANPEQFRRRHGPGAIRRSGIRKHHPATLGKRRGKRIGVDCAAATVIAVLGVGASESSSGDKRHGQDGKPPTRSNPKDDIGEIRVIVRELLRLKNVGVLANGSPDTIGNAGKREVGLGVKPAATGNLDPEAGQRLFAAIKIIHRRRSSNRHHHLLVPDNLDASGTNVVLVAGSRRLNVGVCAAKTINRRRRNRPGAVRRVGIFKLNVIIIFRERGGKRIRVDCATWHTGIISIFNVGTGITSGRLECNNLSILPERSQRMVSRKNRRVRRIKQHPRFNTIRGPTHEFVSWPFRIRKIAIRFPKINHHAPHIAGKCRTSATVCKVKGNLILAIGNPSNTCEVKSMVIANTAIAGINSFMPRYCSACYPTSYVYPIAKPKLSNKISNAAVIVLELSGVKPFNSPCGTPRKIDGPGSTNIRH